MEVLYLAAFIVAVLVLIGVVFARLYVRSSKDTAYVRTGLGGQKVIQDGGALKLPIVHDITWVNMKTLRLEVNRTREGAMITLDRMRVDIGVEFYVRVKPNRESIALAAQTLGERTLKSEQLKELVEAKFVDALRGVAAQMNLTDLHEKRTDFVQKVQNAVAGDLEQNGLELESVSLTALDQTSSEFFNPNNAFDAEGLTRLTEITQLKAKERNEIEQETRIQIEQRNLDADRRSFEITQEKEYARLETERNVANYEAETKAQTAEQVAEAKRLEEEASIRTNLSVQQKQIDSDLMVNQRRIESERDVRLAEQEKAITVAVKSRDESKAEAEANDARAEAVRSEEQVKTVAQVAQAERDKEVAIVAAREEAEKQAVQVTTAADAERRASEDLAEATLIGSRAKAEATKIEAEADAARYQVEADGQEAINAARNVLDQRIIDLELRTALIQALPGIIEASMKPVEKIKDIRIVDMGGNGGLPRINGGTGVGAAGGSGASLPDSIVQALMNYRMQLPLVDELMKEMGLEPAEGLKGFIAGADAPKTEPTSPRESKEEAESTEDATEEDAADERPAG